MKNKFLIIIIVITSFLLSCKFVIKNKSDIEQNRQIHFDLIQSVADEYIWNYDYASIHLLLERQILWNDCITIYVTDNMGNLISGYFKDSINQIKRLRSIDDISNNNNKYLILEKKFERMFEGKNEYYGNIYAIYKR